MLQVPADESAVAAQDWVDFSAVIHKILDSKSHADLGTVLRASVQTFIPHQALVAAWGNFRLGVIHYDFLCADPAVHCEGVEAGALAPGLAMLFQQWVELGRRPMRVAVGLLKDLWPRSGLSESAIAAIASMDTVLLHGIQDRRGSHDCLYAFFDQQKDPSLEENSAARIIVPFLDAAFRQLELPPKPAAVVAPSPVEPINPSASSAESSTQLTEREEEILRWVSLGKSNQEVGEILNLSSFTVKNHMQRIFMKLDVFNRAQAAAVFRSKYGAR